MTGFALLDPWMLLLLAAVPAALWLRRRRGRPAVATGAGPLLAGLPRSLRERLAGAPVALHALGLALGVLALARPVHRELVPLRSEGIDIVLCVDISSSMRETDMDPARARSRLDVVKATADRFVAGRPNDRVGLVLFAAYPEVRCPMTLDHGALRRLLADVETVIPRSEEDRTGIGLGVARAASLLKKSEARSRVVVLLTDGQENVRELSPADAAKLAKDFGVRVYTIGAGVGTPLELIGGVRALDFGEVKSVAETTGGRFFRATDANALEETYRAIDRLEKTELRDPRYRLEELFLALLLPALGLVLLAALADGLLFLEVP